MNLACLGVSHHTAPVERREQLAIPVRALAAAVAALRTTENVEEAVILSTCNRVELYVVSEHPSACFQPLSHFLAARSRTPFAAFQSSLYRLEGRDAVRHVFQVAAGLDSMILGESEITAQIKQAYLTAQTEGATGPVLNRLFQKALHSAKQLRANTRIAEGQASIGSIVSALARQLFGERLRTCEALLWGAGKAAEVTTKHLVRSGIGGVWIVNRTQAKAEDLASLCQGRCLSWEQALKHLAHVDIAIVCTQAPHYVIERADLETILPQRGSRPLFIVDLAVPRNVDPALKGQPGVHLYNIDDLQSLAQTTLAQRQQELAQCEALLDQQVSHFVRWYATHKTKETVPCDLIEARSSL